MTCDSCPMAQRIFDELAAIHALLKPRRCSPADLELLARLLPAIGGKFGSSPVRTREILEDPAIRAIAGSSPGAIGGLLARAADDQADIGGLRVIRSAKEGNAVCWSVERKLPSPFDGPRR